MRRINTVMLSLSVLIMAILGCSLTARTTYAETGISVYIGDERTESMKQAVGDDGNVWIHKENANADTIGEIKNGMTELKPDAVIIMLGLHDIGNTNTGKYVEWISELIETYPDAVIAYVSVNSTSGAENVQPDNGKIEAWNTEIRDALPEEAVYIDTYSPLKDSMKFKELYVINA